jgi:NAD(P)-dependent dehydrogenase (short-subunit alcohol dehydrogenase family)
VTIDQAWLATTFGLAGRTAVVTGGSRGIGYMIAEGLVHAGASVVICSRSEAECADAVERLSRLGSASGHVADLSSAGGCETFADLLASRHDGIDILVNNAGAAWGAPIAEYPESGWDKVMALNVKAPFMLTRSLLPQLEAGATQASPSRVLNIGSIDGLVVPATQNFAYSASKAAVHHLTRVLARELARRHVLVNAIAPGPFESKMTARLIEENAERIEASSPLGRMGRPDDVAATAVFLCGRGSGYITGAVVPVDGGIATTVSSDWIDPSDT